MTSPLGRHLAVRDTSRSRQRGPVKGHRVGASVIVAFALTAIFAVAPPPSPALADSIRAAHAAHEQWQSLTVGSDVKGALVDRGLYDATSGVEALAASGTNYDWAKLVLSSAGWPTSDNNVTVFVRWMRQENGPNNWWNRDNPLNNGWGSGGGAGTGRYPNLVVAAQKAADALQRNAGYAGIRAAFAASAPTAVTESAIWASPWATSHYANGAHWSYAPVPAFQAPASAW